MWPSLLLSKEQLRRGNIFKRKNWIWEQLGCTGEGEEEVEDGFWNSAWADVWMKIPHPYIKKELARLGDADWEFRFGHAELAMPMKYPIRDIEQAVGKSWINCISATWGSRSGKENSKTEATKKKKISEWE